MFTSAVVIEVLAGVFVGKMRAKFSKYLLLISLVVLLVLGKPLSTAANGSRNNKKRKKPIQKRQPIATVDEPLRTELINLASVIKGLVELRKACGGELPDGEIGRARDEIKQRTGKSKTKRQIIYAMNKYEEYHSTHKGEAPANAFTPLPSKKPKGRSISPDVQSFIEDACINVEWRVLNHDNSTSKIIRVLRPSLIHELVEVEFPDEKISLRTTYRIIRDFEEREGARVQAARKRAQALLKNMPSIDNDVEGVHERWQSDIRLLPIRTRYKGQECTVVLLYIVDDLTGYIVGWDLLPRKEVSEEGELFTQDFTCRKVRYHLALAMLEMGVRPRILYADNGAQYGQALEPFMDFIVSEDSVPTILVHTEPEAPRGRGKVERRLALINGFLELCPGFIDEDDYRESIRRGKKELIYEFDFLYREMKSFVDHWNTKRSKQKPDVPSRREQLQQGVDKSLPAPKLENLAVFAEPTKAEQPRQISTDGFWYQRERYVAVRQDEEMYVLWHTAVDNKVSAHILPFKLEKDDVRETIILFSLDDQATWHVAMRKSLLKLSRTRHSDLMKAARAQMIGTNKERSSIFLERILNAAEGPLVINKLDRTFQHHVPTSASLKSTDEQPTDSTPDSETLPDNAPTMQSDDTPVDGAPPAEEQLAQGTDTPVDSAPPAEKHPAQRGTTSDADTSPIEEHSTPAEPSEPSPQSSVSDDDQEDDDIDAFIAQLDQELAKK
jgi:hypothetical protein